MTEVTLEEFTEDLTNLYIGSNSTIQDAGWLLEKYAIYKREDLVEPDEVFGEEDDADAGGVDYIPSAMQLDALRTMHTAEKSRADTLMEVIEMWCKRGCADTRMNREIQDMEKVIEAPHCANCSYREAYRNRADDFFWSEEPPTKEDIGKMFVAEMNNGTILAGIVTENSYGLCFHFIGTINGELHSHGNMKVTSPDIFRWMRIN